MSVINIVTVNGHDKSLSALRNPSFDSFRIQPRNREISFRFHPRTRAERRHSLSVNGCARSSEPNTPHDEDESAGVKAALSMLRFYKREISPLMPRSCRFVPTCSEYSMEAYKKYGVVKGTVLTAWRLCRCNPLGGSGFDPPRWFDEPPPPLPPDEDDDFLS